MESIPVTHTSIGPVNIWRILHEEDMNFMFEWQASLTREILFLPREHKIHIFEKPIQQKQKAGIVTSLNDTTLTKVTYGKYATRVPDEVAYGIYEWFSSQ